ncbi:MAG: hypothetical protein HQK55_18085, partial [Deltaproteobacteria bacterium]|nr:hypothetical protein [Deltaproteobacteria bacterium]
MTDLETTTPEHSSTVNPEIDLNQADLSFINEVTGGLGGERIRRCYACGVCSARCPVGELMPEFDPRR